MALLAVLLAASAQRTTGDIRGVITDESGAVLPGVTVTPRGAAIPGARTSVSNETGTARFPGPAAGQLRGDGGAVRLRPPAPSATCRWRSAGRPEIDIQMKLSTQSETITVTAAAPVVDSSSTQVATNYSREWVENAPVRRFRPPFDLVNAAPGVSPSTSTSSPVKSLVGDQREHALLDGTDFTAPLTGAAWPWPNTDAIEEVQVLSSVRPRTTGKPAGAVFNVVTRQGSNTFHGTPTYFQSQDLTGRNTTTTRRRAALQP
ncbi:MAG: hypothetical protein R2712_04330 [Vicinamibacterales bacterium]